MPQPHDGCRLPAPCINVAVHAIVTSDMAAVPVSWQFAGSLQACMLAGWHGIRYCHMHQCTAGAALHISGALQIRARPCGCMGRVNIVGGHGVYLPHAWMSACESCSSHASLPAIGTVLGAQLGDDVSATANHAWRHLQSTQMDVDAKSAATVVLAMSSNFAMISLCWQSSTTRMNRLQLQVG